MYALSGMQIRKSTSDIGSERHAQSPRKGLLTIMDVGAQVSVLDEFGDDEDTAVRSRGARETEIQNYIRMTCLSTGK